MANNLLVLGGLGIGGYLAYQYYQKNAAVGSPASGVLPQAPAGSAASQQPSGSQPAPQVPASYSGPSLDQIYAQLLSAAIAGMKGGDTSVSCAGLSGYRRGLGIGGRGTSLRSSGDPTAPLPDPRFTHPVAGGIALRSTGSASAAPVSCSTPTATYDVWNWYLVNRTNAGISSGPSSSDAGVDPTVQLTAAQFWAAVAPLLRQRIPGISGFGFFASVFRGMGALTDCPGGPGCPDTADITNLPTSPAPINPYVLAVAQADPNAAFNPNTGSINVPLSVQSPSWFPGVSNGAVVLGGGAAVLLLGVFAGGRKR